MELKQERSGETLQSEQQKIWRLAKSFSYHHFMRVPLFRHEQKPGLNHSMTSVSQTRATSPIDQKARETESGRGLTKERVVRSGFSLPCCLITRFHNNLALFHHQLSLYFFFFITRRVWCKTFPNTNKSKSGLVPHHTASLHPGVLQDSCLKICKT